MKKVIAGLMLFLLLSTNALCGESVENLCTSIELTPSTTEKVLGNPINCSGVKTIGLMLDVEGYNATGVQIKPRAQYTSGGTDYEIVNTTGTGEIVTVDDSKIYELSGTLTQNVFIKIDVEGVPYLEISANATISELVTGTGATITRADIIKLEQ